MANVQEIVVTDLIRQRRRLERELDLVTDEDRIGYLPPAIKKSWVTSFRDQIKELDRRIQAIAEQSR